MGAYWLAIKAFFLNVKVWAVLGAMLLCMVYAYQKGKASCQAKAYEALEEELERQQDKTAKAIKQAVSDARSLQARKEKGNALVEEARAMDHGSCNLSDDELLHLQRVQKGTAVK